MTLQGSVRRKTLKFADERLMSSALFGYLPAEDLICFFEMRLSPWDYAAGMLIVTEAGGIISDMQGKPLKLTEPCSVIASNTACYSRLKEICK